MTGSSGSEPPIRFGTSGWRGLLAEEFTLPRLRLALRGVGRWLAHRGGGEVVVAHDTRLLGERMSELAVRILQEHGLRPVLGAGPTPTPVAARAVLRRAAAGAVVLTASHNPPEYHGMKVLGPEGAGIDDATARRIEGWIAESPAHPPEAGAAPRPLDLRGPYLRELLSTLRPARSRRVQVVYDAMHGAGAGVLDAALERLGAPVRLLRGERNPAFGGGPPDPVPEQLRLLGREVRTRRAARLGIATDGDADRFGAVDAEGRVLSATQALALLVDHLARTGRASRGVAISVATGSLVERVAASHGLAVRRHPIGFKHLSRALAAGEADVAGEESGGFAFAGFGHDKDGILAGCLLVELLAGGSASLRERLAELERRHGRSACGRIALLAHGGAREALNALGCRPPARIDGARVREVARCDGLRFGLDDGFVMLRLSGTEPVLRVYAEARGPRLLQRRLAAAAALARRSGVSQGSG